MVTLGMNFLFGVAIELKVSSNSVLLSMEVKGNLIIKQVSHCQLPLNSWKLWFAFFNLLHFTCILQLQFEQGIPRFFFFEFYFADVADFREFSC